MGHTNSTPNISLPQFIGTDKPTWLGDINGAMSTIDTKVGSIDAAVATIDAKADNAVADASGAVTTATNAVNTAGAASTTATQANNLATQALTVANNTAHLCSDQIVPDVQANKTAIGTLEDLRTTDKSNLVNAINEVNAKPAGTKSLIGASSTSGTNAAKIAEIKTLFDGLTAIEKLNAVIVISGGVYSLIDVTSGQFSRNLGNATSYVSYVINMSNSTLMQYGGGSYTDESSKTNASAFELYA